MERQRDRFRKFQSGADKRKKLKKKEEFNKSLHGSLDKFLNNSPVVVPDDDTEQQLADCYAGATRREDPPPTDGNGSESDFSFSEHRDLDDPGTWPAHLDAKLVDLIIEKGPVKVFDFDFPKAPDKRHFSRDFYTRKLPNGENARRDWLVYSKTRDSVFCFCCKLFNTCSSRPMLANNGLNDWRHLSTKLKEHETSRDHITSATKWIEARRRFDTETCIDQSLERQIARERAILYCDDVTRRHRIT
ncbi:Zinc finger MYM-type protein 5 [Merluccius polli]|uniref:Zinc finger MYM-type protein 5 n=1 Tax=Merluccius polli TaxID=89951 RepID=A0AA47N7F0_MERPO|nr:Zinc finger MYM-type protein 5 [Merluccius polli]